VINSNLVHRTVSEIQRLVS